MSFDPYHKWLGIPKKYRPPTYYRLLGIDPEEDDIEVIEEAAIRQSAHLRAYQAGEHAEICARMLEEISKARDTLIHPAKRKAYDQTLMKKRQQKADERRQALQTESAASSALEGMDAPSRTSRERNGAGRRSSSPPSIRKGHARTNQSPNRMPLILGISGGVGVLLIAVVVLVAMGGGNEPENPKSPSKDESTFVKGPIEKPIQVDQGKVIPKPNIADDRDRTIPKPKDRSLPLPQGKANAVPIGKPGAMAKKVFAHSFGNTPGQLGDFIYEREKGWVTLRSASIATYDLNTKQRVRTYSSDTKFSNTWSHLILSPDRQLLYVLKPKGSWTLMFSYKFAQGGFWRTTNLSRLQSTMVEVLDNEQVVVVDLKKWRLWNLPTKKVIYHSPESASKYKASARSADGKTLYLASDKQLELWDIARREKSQSISLPIDVASHLDVGPNGLIAVGGVKARQHGILLLQPEANKSTFIPSDSLVYQAKVSPDGKWLLANGLKGLIGVWNVENLKQRIEFPVQNTRIRHVKFSSDSKQICCTTDEGEFQIWEFPEGQQALNNPEPKTLQSKTVYTAGRGGIPASQMHLDPQRNVFYTVGKTLQKHNIQTGAKDWEVSNENRFANEGAVEVSEDGSTVYASFGNDHDIRILDSAQGKELARLSGHNENVRVIKLLPGEDTLFSMSRSDIFFWDLKTKKKISQANEPKSIIYTHALFDAQRKSAFVLTHRGMLITWDLQQMKAVFARKLPAWGPTCAAYANGNLVVGYNDRIVFLNLKTKAFHFVFQDQMVSSLDISSDGQFAFFRPFGGGGTRVELWHVPTRRRLIEKAISQYIPHLIKFLPGNKEVALLTHDKLIFMRLPDLTQQLGHLIPAPDPFQPKLLQTIPVSGSTSIQGFVHTTDDHLFAMTSSGTFKLNVPNKRIVSVYPKATGNYRAFTFPTLELSKDGKRLFESTINTNQIGIRDTSNGRVIAKLQSPDKAVTGFALLPEKEQLLMVTEQSLSLWDTKTNNMTQRSELFSFECRTMCLSMDHSTVYLVGKKIVEKWDAQQLKKIQSTPIPIQTASGMFYSPTHHIVLAGRNNFGHTLLFLLDKQLKVLRTIPVPETISSIDFSEKGDRALLGGSHEYLAMWNTDTWEQEYRMAGLSIGTIHDVDFSEKDNRISAPSNGTIRIWELPKPGEIGK